MQARDPSRSPAEDSQHKTKKVKKGGLQIWSLQISCFQRMPGRNNVLVFLEHHQLTQHS
jgi:hypothetical protein